MSSEQCITPEQVEEAMRNSLPEMGETEREDAIKRVTYSLIHGVPAEMYDMLHGFSEEYRDNVVTGYNGISEFVHRIAGKDIIAEDSRLPALTAFAEKLASLEGAYEVMRRRKWEPQLVFVPRGLGVEGFERLMHGQGLPNPYTRYFCIYGEFGHSLSLSASEPVHMEWDVAIVSGSDEPKYTNISADGVHGWQAERAVPAIKRLPWLSDDRLDTPESAVQAISPSEDAYLGLQLKQLIDGEPFVDMRSASYVRSAEDDEDMLVYTTKGYLYNPHDYVASGPGNHSVRLNSGIAIAHLASQARGIRPAAEYLPQ